MLKTESEASDQRGKREPKMDTAAEDKKKDLPRGT